MEPPFFLLRQACAWRPHRESLLSRLQLIAEAVAMSRRFGIGAGQPDDRSIRCNREHARNRRQIIQKNARLRLPGGLPI